MRAWDDFHTDNLMTYLYLGGLIELTSRCWRFIAACPSGRAQRGAHYDFLTTWCFDAPIERVFDVLNDSAVFPEWWKRVSAVEVLEPRDADGVGELARYSWRSVLPYTLHFDSRDARGAAAPDRGSRNRGS
jgi:uncharacterized membrane protein